MDYMTECRICPRRCGVNRSTGDTGFCGMDSRIKIARAALHFWEEPCLSGENGSGTVFFSGCSLRCVFCQNYKISTCRAGRFITESQLSDIFLDLQRQGAHNINLVTAAHFIPQIIPAIISAKKAGLNIPIVYNSSGYEEVWALKLLDGLVDIYLPDFKYFDNNIAEKYSAAKDYRRIVQAAIGEMFRQTGGAVFDERGIMQKGVIVRHLMLPGRLFDSKKIIDYLYNTYKNGIWISIMNQYTPLEHVSGIPELNRAVDGRHYKALVEYTAGLGAENVYIQEGGTVSESFIPEFYDE